MRQRLSRFVAFCFLVTPDPPPGGVTVNRKLAVISAIMIILITALLCSASVASAGKSKTLRFKVVKHARSYDVVRGHGQKLRVRNHARFVKGRGQRRYKVVARHTSYVVLFRVTAAAQSTATNTQITSGDSVASGCPATASSSLTGCAPSAADDGQAVTHWAASSRSYPQWWTVDLGAVKTVTGVKTDWYNSQWRVYRYRVETSTDGTTFTAAADRSANQTQGATTDALSVSARYVRVQVLGVNVYHAVAAINEITVYATTSDSTPTPTPTATATVTPTPTPTATVTPTPTPTSTGLAVAALSATHAAAGASLTISGSGFGASQGASSVTFGERVNELGFASIAKTASISSWSDTQIVVKVPALSPGTAAAASTHQPVYVTVGGAMSNSADFFVDPATTITGQTFSTASANGYRIPNGTHDTVYQNCTFTATNPNIDGTSWGCVVLGQGGYSNYDITFVDCTFTGNTGSGLASGDAYKDGVNGIKAVNWGSEATHDVTFAGCNFGQFSRMGAELIGGGSDTVGVPRYAFVGCSFEPDGAENISYSFMPPAYGLVDGCTFKGWGNLAIPVYTASFEAAQTGYIEVRDSDFWSGRGGALNCWRNATSAASYLLFKHLDIDYTHSYETYQVRSGYDRALSFQNINYARLDGLTINTGNSAEHVFNAGYADTGAGWATCVGNDFTGSTITGYCQSTAGVPASAAKYWDSAIAASNVLPAKR